MRFALIRRIVTTAVFALCVAALAAGAYAQTDATPPDTPDPQPPQVKEAIELFKAQRWEDAYAKLKEAKAEKADLAAPGLMMADLFRQANNAGMMRLYIERAIVDDPNEVSAMMALANIDLQNRMTIEAEMLYERAEKALPAYVAPEDRKKLILASIHGNLAGIAGSRKKWDEAQKRLEAWLQLDPKNVNALQRLANVLFQKGDARAAKDRLVEAEEADPKVLNHAAQLAMLYERDGNREKATQWMNYALQLKSDDLNTRLVAANWALNTDQTAIAKREADAALKLDPTSAQAVMLSGIVALIQGDYAGAESFFQKAHAMSPASFAATNNLALALCEQDDATKRRRALEYAQSNVRQTQRTNNAPEAASTLGWVLYKMDRKNEALQSLQQSVQAGNRRPDTLYYLAQVSADLDQKENAGKLLEAALQTKEPFSKRKEAEALLAELK